MKCFCPLYSKIRIAQSHIILVVGAVTLADSTNKKLIVICVKGTCGYSTEEKVYGAAFDEKKNVCN